MHERPTQALAVGQVVVAHTPLHERGKLQNSCLKDKRTPVTSVKQEYVNIKWKKYKIEVSVNLFFRIWGFSTLFFRSVSVCTLAGKPYIEKEVAFDTIFVVDTAWRFESQNLRKYMLLCPLPHAPCNYEQNWARNVKIL